MPDRPAFKETARKRQPAAKRPAILAAPEAAGAELLAPITAAPAMTAAVAPALVDVAPQVLPATAQQEEEQVAPAPAAADQPKQDVTPAEPDVPAEAAEQGTEGMATIADNVTNTTTGAGADRARAMFGDMNERTKTAIEKSAKVAEEMTDLTKGNVEALVASGRAAAKGAEAMFQEASELSRKNFERFSGVVQSLASVKSPAELFQLQSDFAKSSFDNAVAGASKASEAYVKYVSDVFEPISTRVAVAADKVKAATSF